MRFTPQTVYWSRGVKPAHPLTFQTQSTNQDARWITLLRPFISDLLFLLDFFSRKLELKLVSTIGKQDN